MSKGNVDYSLYLVTDSTAAILGDRSLVEIVRSALGGGVTIVQYRDKYCSDEDMVKTARELHAVTKEFGAPLLINDRVDVAAQVGCEGVHLGQADTEIEKARALLGNDKIIGATVRSMEQAIKACEAGADYLSMGAVFATPTKTDTKAILGPSGVQEILSGLVDSGYDSIPTICIGGINVSNSWAVLSQSRAAGKSLDGLAVVSALVGAPDACTVARDLMSRVLASRIPHILRRVAAQTPVSHNMTNTVVQNFAANVALAIGASPIMSKHAEEAADLASLGGALLINMGTLTLDDLNGYMQALKAYNAAGRPVILDPVGAGATAVRREAVKTLLSSGRFAVIKGNLSEILAIAGESVSQRGVDSGDDASMTVPQRVRIVLDLAKQHKCIVLLTGAADIISDGRRTVRVDNGHGLMGMITGTGCALGTAVSAMIAACGSSDVDRFAAVVAGTVIFGVAAESAADRPDVRGPGTFVPAFIDELYKIRKETVEGDLQWLDMARVR